MVRLLPWATVVVLLVGCANPPTESQRNEITAPATPEARAVAALIRLQKPTGGFGTETTENVGITALAALAMLSSQDVPASDTNEPLRRATKFLMAAQQKDGLLANEGDAGPMYGHGFATLYLTQAYQTTADAALKARLKDVIERAVKQIERSQNRDGGWRYTATPADADVSVTAAELRALTAAKGAGFAVDPKAIERAVSYIRDCQAPDGGFRYMTGAGDSAWARSAAATAALLYAGSANPKGVAYLSTAEQRVSEGFFYYGSYYMAQAMNVEGTRSAKTFADLRARLLERQDAQTGLWTGEAGDAYATSMALVVLSIPKSRLPAFGGK